MKKSLYLSVLVLCACGTGSPIMDDETRRVATSVFDAFNTHDWKRMESLYSDSVKLQDPAYPGGKTGKAGLTDFYRSVPDIYDSLVNIAVDGNIATVEFVSTGTINGEKFTLPICAVLVIQNGLVVSDRTYYDATH
jgi:predicted SnoaL-like aldol condensation-catalyzing enzyme